MRRVDAPPRLPLGRDVMANASASGLTVTEPVPGPGVFVSVGGTGVLVGVGGTPVLVGVGVGPPPGLQEA